MSSRASMDPSVIGHLIRRYRRPLAAVSAGLAVMLALAVITSPSPAAVQTEMEIAAGPAPGEVAAPITLASSEIASSLSVGDIIDIVAIPAARNAEQVLNSGQTGRATILARKARVLQVSDSQGFTSNSSALIVIAVSESVALTLADATSSSHFTALIH
jgi:hypothetical protein